MKVNGKNIEIAQSGNITVSDYLLTLKLNPGTVAIEFNGEILDRNKWTETLLAKDDRIEIIKFVGGG